MGSVGKAVGGGGSAQQSSQSDRYDYTSGTAQEAVDRFKAATGVDVDASVANIDRDNLSHLLETVHRMKDEAGIAPLKITSRERSGIASTDGSNLNINPKYYSYSREAFEKLAQSNFDEKYHPSPNADNFIEHEYGHMLAFNYINSTIGARYDGTEITGTGLVRTTGGFLAKWEAAKDWNSAISWTKDSSSKDLVKTAISNVRSSGVIIKGGMRGYANSISGYAKTSPAECIAEAYADVRANGSSANALSKEIVRLLTA